MSAKVCGKRAPQGFLRPEATLDLTEHLCTRKRKVAGVIEGFKHTWSRFLPHFRASQESKALGELILNRRL